MKPDTRAHTEPMRRPDSCFSIHDLERQARARLPRPLFDYIRGGADDERTVAANNAAFDRYPLIPNCVRTIGEVDTRCRILGEELAWPLYLAPTGMTRLFHSAGETAVARQAAHAGVGYALSTMGTTAIEAIGAVAPGPRMFQLYVFNDDGLNRELLDRCKAAGFKSICITVDTIVAGKRERDLRAGLTFPPRLGLRSLAQFAAKPGWCCNYLFAERFSFPNLPGLGENALTLQSLANRMERDVSWDLVERLRSHWGGPLAIKGIQSIDDAQAARSAGVSAIILSNHGGRQLDGTPATLDLLAGVADAVADEVDIILDGGVRRGTHIAKALALGATACMTGRPYLYGLAAHGEAGVGRALSILRDEFERALILLGCPKAGDLGRHHLLSANQGRGPF